MSVTSCFSIAQNREKLGVMPSHNREESTEPELVLALEFYLIVTKGIPKMSGPAL